MSEKFNVKAVIDVRSGGVPSLTVDGVEFGYVIEPGSEVSFVDDESGRDGARLTITLRVDDLTILTGHREGCCQKCGQPTSGQTCAACTTLTASEPAEDAARHMVKRHQWQLGGRVK